MKSLSDYICHLLVQPPTIQHGGRKIFLNETLECPDFMDSTFDLGVVGYTGTKLCQLMRNYWNEAALADARLELIKAKRKPDYSVGWNTYGKPKAGKTSQGGYCLQAMTLVKIKNEDYRLNVFYRTVEITKKFYADLYFIKYKIIPYFGVRPDLVTFYFSSVTLNNLYLPVMLQFIVNHREVFNKCKETDKNFYRAMCKWAEDYTRVDHKWPYMEMRRMQDMVTKSQLVWLRILAADHPKMLKRTLTNNASSNIIRKYIEQGS